MARATEAKVSGVVTLNVGGASVTTLESTLLVAWGTHLADMLNSANNEGSKEFPRDADGAPFLDCDPELFRALLGHLRVCRDLLPGQPRPKVIVPAHKEAEFENMINKLRCREVIGWVGHPRSFQSGASASPAEPSVAINIRHDLDGSASPGWKFWLCKNDLLAGRHAVAWRVMVTQVPTAAPPTREPAMIFVGIEIGFGGPSNQQRMRVGAASDGLQLFGAALREGPEAWRPCTWQAGDIAIFRLDAGGAQLRMFHKRSGRSLRWPLGDQHTGCTVCLGVAGGAASAHLGIPSNAELREAGLE